MDSLPSPSINNLQLLFTNFGLANNGNGTATSLRRINPPPGFGSEPRTRKEQEPASFADFYEKLLQSGAGIPLYPRSIWNDLGTFPALNSNSYNNYTTPAPPIPSHNLDDVMEQALTLEGSQNLQNLLSLGDERIVGQIFDGVIGSILSLMTEEHGHYVFWKLIPHLGQDQVVKIAEMLCQQNGKPIIDASFNSNGSHSLQRLLKPLIRWETVGPVVAALAGEFYRLMRDATARSVVLKCVELLPPEKSEPLYRAAIDCWLDLARDPTGCVSLNNFIEHVKGSMRKELLDKISDYSVFLAQDPTANHLLQRVMKLRDPIITEKICGLLKGEFANLAVQKAGSYVVEKCLKSSEWAYAVDDLLRSGSDEFLQIAKNKYGNYVVQEALRVTKAQSPGDRHVKLLEKLKAHFSSLQYGHGKNVLHEMAKLK